MKKNEFLEKLRKDLGYSRKKIAEYLEISPSTIEKYEKGRLDFNHKTKYVLGLCALASYNNEVFSIFEEYEVVNIDEELKHYKISKFSSNIRQILYFLELDYDEYLFFLKNLLLKQTKISFFNHKSFLNEIYDFILNDSNSNCPNKEYYNKQLEDIPSNVKEEIINIREEISDYAYALQIIFLYALKFFNPRDFYCKKDFGNLKKILNSFSIFHKIFSSLQEDDIPISYIIESDFNQDIKQLQKLFPTIKQTIEELMIKGKPVNKETIKEFKIELETGAILSTCNEPTDPKDKQICELLQYAPPAFKDKIIEKLLKFKDEVEDI